MAETWLDRIKATMGPLERLAALKVTWWAKREGGQLMMSFLGPYAKTAVAVLQAALGALAMSGSIPIEWQPVLLGTISLLAALSGTPTRPFDPSSGRTIEAIPNAQLTPKSK